MTLADQAKVFLQKYRQDKPVLVYYVRDNRGRPYGTVVGTVDENDHVVVGYSQCNRKSDVFNKRIGTYIALQRALTVGPVQQELDENSFETMYNRVHRYLSKNAARQLENVQL